MALELRAFADRLCVTDGAWGTELQARGLPAGAPPELWNVESPSAVEQVARSYVEAGSEIILTNTFGANRFVLSGHGAEDRVTELAEAGVAISRRAAGQTAKVFASIGPTGKIVMTGDVPKEQIASAFAETAAAITRGGADGIVLESFHELDELVIALMAAREAALPIVACMTFASGPHGTATMMGSQPADLAAVAQEGGAAAVGANCGAGPDRYVQVAGLLRQKTSLPIWIKPNAGVPEARADGTAVFPVGPEAFASFAKPLAEAGAAFLGGCCGSTPDHIRALRVAVDAINAARGG